MMIADKKRLVWSPGITKFDHSQWQSLSDEIKETENELNESRCFNLDIWREYIYQRNCKTILSPTSSSGWTPISGTTLSTDTTNTWYSTGALKLLRNTGGAGYLGGYTSLSSLNLNQFNDGSVSTINDAIVVSLYLSNSALIGEYLEIRLGNDDSNYYKSYKQGSISSLFTSFISLKSEFIAVGNPNWSNITYFKIFCYGWYDFQNEHCTLQNISLVRRDLSYTTCNPFLEYDPATTSYKYIEGTNYNDYRWVSIIDSSIDSLNPVIVNVRYSTTRQHAKLNLTTKSWKNFYLKGVLCCKTAGYLGGFGFYIDEDNYLYNYIDNNTYYVVKCKNGVITTLTIATSLVVNKHVVYTIDRQNGHFRFYVNPGSPRVFEFKDEYNDSLGYLFYRIENNRKFGYLKDVIITNDINDKMNVGGRLY